MGLMDKSSHESLAKSFIDVGIITGDEEEASAVVGATDVVVTVVDAVITDADAVDIAVVDIAVGVVIDALSSLIM